MNVDETGTLALLRAHRAELIDPLIAEYGGRNVKTTGDGLLLEFSSVLAAVHCCVEVQDVMEVRNAGVVGDEAIRFRIGVHLGDIVVEGGDIFGNGGWFQAGRDRRIFQPVAQFGNGALRVGCFSTRWGNGQY